jgi:hypothetical protein
MKTSLSHSTIQDRLMHAIAALANQNIHSQLRIVLLDLNTRLATQSIPDKDYENVAIFIVILLSNQLSIIEDPKLDASPLKALFQQCMAHLQVNAAFTSAKKTFS